jgi:hypothetical protein
MHDGSEIIYIATIIGLTVVIMAVIGLAMMLGAFTT